MPTAVLNHLWQSTLCALVLGLMTLAFRRNSARTRYWLWWVASLKFLVPFSWLASLGGLLKTYVPLHVGSPLTSSFGWSPTTALVMRAVSFPVADQVFTAEAGFDPIEAFVAVWSTGFFVVIGIWFVRCHRVYRVLSEAAPIELPIPIPVRSSTASIEPGVVGWLRPVLLVPAGIERHLSAAQMQALLHHELAHVRRHDNLTATMHMLVEAVWWFHPMVWWLGGRLVEERERACDEAVLAAGNQPETYAEAILKVCQHYIESALPCVSGISGSDLKRRVLTIMNSPPPCNLTLGKKILIGAVLMLGTAAPVVVGLLKAKTAIAESTLTVERPVFVVASLKIHLESVVGRGMSYSSGKLTVPNKSLKQLIKLAYDVYDEQIIGGPEWSDSARYDIVLTGDESQFSGPFGGEWQARRMLQALLADRFSLKFQREQRTLSIAVLTVIGEGAGRNPGTSRQGDWQGIKSGTGQLVGRNITTARLAALVSKTVGRSVLDGTHLSGGYNLDAKWVPAAGEVAGYQWTSLAGPEPEPEWNDNPQNRSMSFEAALRDQLGMALVIKPIEVEVLVVNSAERPEEV